jgi:Tfp pilus assembly protein PilV
MKFVRRKNRLICPLTPPGDDQRGFTLIETCIAFVVMMVAALGAASLFVFSIEYGSGAYDRTLAIAVAQQRMEKLRKGSFDEVVSANDPDVISSNRHFNVVTTVTGTNLKTITVTVTPAGGKDWVRNGVVVVSQRSALGTGAFY